MTSPPKDRQDSGTDPASIERERDRVAEILAQHGMLDTAHRYMRACASLASPAALVEQPSAREQLLYDMLTLTALRAYPDKSKNDIRADIDARLAAHPGRELPSKGATEDECIAIDFYRSNPSAALFDFRTRLGGESPAVAAPQPLTDEQIAKLAETEWSRGRGLRDLMRLVARAVERHHGIGAPAEQPPSQGAPE